MLAFLGMGTGALAQSDLDGDGVVDGLDNCRFRLNADQLDQGGLASGDEDGIGDVCQCGEVSGDGSIDVVDLVALRDALAALGTLAAPSRCSVRGTTDAIDGDQDGLPDDCRIDDVATLTRALTGTVPPGLDPGIAQVCRPATLSDLDPTMPVITILSPADQATIAGPTVLVTGTVSDASPIVALIADVRFDAPPAALLPGSTFAFTYTLNPAPSQLSVIGMQAVDAAGNVGVTGISVSAGTNATPVLDPINPDAPDPVEVALGTTLLLDLRATDANPLTFSATPLPLPSGAALVPVGSQVPGEHRARFTFTPGLAQVGTIPLTFRVTDGALSDEETVQIQVNGPSGGATALQGRVLDANSMAIGQVVPLQGITVRSLPSGPSTTTDASGDFLLTGLTPGAQTINYEQETPSPAYGGYRATEVAVSGVTRVLARDILLPRMAGAASTNIVANMDTNLTHAGIGVSLFIPMNAVQRDGQGYVGPISIAEVPAGFTPGALPDTLEPSLVITIQPMGLTFSAPVPVTFPNVDGLTDGSEVDIWSLRHADGVFFVAGTGEVIGGQITTLAGGVRESSWHFVLPPATTSAAVPRADGDVHDPERCSGCTGFGSDLVVPSGAISSSFELPAYVAQSRARSLRFVYRSDRAHPEPILPFEPTIPGRAAVPERVAWQATLAGVLQGAPAFVNTSGLSGSQDQPLRGAVKLSASDLATGSYPVSVRVTSEYVGARTARVSSRIEERAIVVNESQSPFGAGWSLAGLQRVYMQPDQSVVITDGDGSHVRFGPPAETSGVATAGNLIDVAAMPNVVGGGGTASGSECDTRIRLFAEQTGVVLAEPLGVDLSEPRSVTAEAQLVETMLAAGRTVSSYFLHFDPRDGLARRLGGTVTFDRPILGVIALSTSLTASDAVLGNPGTIYPASAERGAEFMPQTGGPDSITLSSDRRTFSVDLGVTAGVDGTNVDQVRVVVDGAPAEPPSDVLLLDRFDCENRGQGRADHRDFANWGVGANGQVDLLALGFFGSSDARVELVGGTAQEGTLTSTTSFALAPGDYLLSFMLRTGGVDQNSMTVSLGGAFSEQFVRTLAPPTPTNPDQDVMEPIARQVRVTSPTSAALVFAHAMDSANDNQGLRIDDVVLRRSSGYSRPPGEFSTLRRNNDGTFERILVDGTRLEFSAAGLQTARVEPNGSRTTYGYSGGLLTSIVDPLGSIASPTSGVTTLLHVGGMVAITDPAGRQTVLMRSGTGDLRDVELPDDSRLFFEYDAQHRLLAETDARGYTTLHDFDAAGRLERADRPTGATRLASNAQGVGLVDPSTGVGTEANPAPVRRPSDGISQITDAENRMTRIDSGPLGAAESVIDVATGLETTITRDAAGNPEVTQLPSGHSVTRTFDAKGNVEDVDDSALASTLAFTYHPIWNGVEMITDSRGTWNPEYDAANGNLLAVNSPELRSTTFTYYLADADPQTGSDRLLQTITDRLGTETTLRYDARGNLEEIEQGSNLSPGEERLTSFTYTPAGYVDTIMDAAGRVTNLDYDLIGRVTRQTLPGSRVVDFAYDDAGNLTSLLPPGQPWHYFGYDAGDRETRYDPPNAFSGLRATTYRYNREDQLLEIARPDHRDVGLVYDASGRLDSFTSVEGSTARLHDLVYAPATGLLTSLSVAGGPTLGFGYAAQSSLLNSTSWSGSGTVTGTVSWTYDPDGRLGTQTVGTTPAVAFDYDNDGLLTDAGALLLTRDPAEFPDSGMLAGTTLALVTTALDHNAFGELEEEEALFGASPLYLLEILSRDALGRIATKRETIGTDPAVTTDYTYDPAGRLDTVTIDGVPARDYAYDLNGNRLAEQAAPAIATYDSQDRLQSYGATSYAYTPGGDLKTKTDASGTTSYAYDGLSNLRRVDRPGGLPVIEYEIDGANRRVGKLVNGTRTKGWLYQDGLRVVAELDGANAVVSRFVYGSKPNVPDYMVRQGVTYRILSDHLGSVRLVVNAATGAIAQRIDYDEWGTPTYVTGTGTADFQPFGFAGGLQDPDTGLVRFGARDYDSSVGRWTTKDPIRFASQEWGLYAYVLSDPVNRADPTGLAMACVQRRSGTRSLLVCHDSMDDSISSYPLLEPAANYASDAPYGPGGQLPPGLYELLPRASQGRVLPRGAPLYTTPGQEAGVVLDPDGRRRDFIGAHLGTSSLGCPLFGAAIDPLARGRRDEFDRRFTANLSSGGTSVLVVDVE